MDYKNKEYAEFVEQAVKEIFQLDPNSILIMAELEDGKLLTCNYHLSPGARGRMLAGLLSDQIVDVVKMNFSEDCDD